MVFRDDGSWSWTIGCNSHDGFHRAMTGGRLRLLPHVSTEMMCADAGERAMERAFAGGVYVYRLEGSRLRLATPAGELVLQRAP